MASSAPTRAPLLQVKHLQTHFFTDAGVVKFESKRKVPALTVTLPA